MTGLFKFYNKFFCVLGKALSGELSCKMTGLVILPYILDYEVEGFLFQNNPKNLDLSYKTDLDFLDCL